MGTLPRNYKLARSVNHAILASDEYENWTAADLIDLLGEYRPEAPVFIRAGRSTVRPLELISGSECELILG